MMKTLRSELYVTVGQHTFAETPLRHVEDPLTPGDEKDPSFHLCHVPGAPRASVDRNAVHPPYAINPGATFGADMMLE